MQLARLFLRGSLMNETAKLLTKEDITQVETLMNEAWEDPALQNQKLEFCMALSRTIGNEYKDIEIGKQDARITFWKAALLVLFHESRQCTKCNEIYITTKNKIDTCSKCGITLLIKWSPKPQIASDPIKRKKFFQTIMFNYLRQIFRENKPPTIKEHKTENGDAQDVALRTICGVLDKIKSVAYNAEKIYDDHYIIHCETGLLPLRVIEQIAIIKHNLEQYGVQINTNWQSINIISTLEIPQIINYQIVNKIYARFTSLDGNNDDDTDTNHRHHYEYKVVSRINVDEQVANEYGEVIAILRSRLSDDAKKLLDIIIDTPQVYIDRFKTNKLHKAHLAEYFDRDPREIEDMKDMIRLHCLSLNIGID